EFFREIHGRRFNTLNPTYFLPADDEEIKRSSLLHRLIKFIFGGRIYTGPLREVVQFGPYRKALDLGTGSGEWAVELSDEISYVFVTGVDSAPIQFQFEIWDANVPEMPYEDAYFDLIHARAIHTGIRDYPHFLAEVARILRPGGLIILIEPDLTQYVRRPPPASNLEAHGRPEPEFPPGTGPCGWFTLWETYRRCLSLLGVDVTVPGRLRQLLEATGLFESIEDLEVVVPVGFYPQGRRALTMGELQWMAYDLLLPALKPMFLSLGMLESTVDRIIKDATAELYYGNSDFELSSHLHVVNAKRK
ncbi:S-adenosyl-L-methionine-dependent methyltransferase, partial [Mycena albidolilacea]